MHGVSKTQLSDEQKEAKRLERQKKQERFLKVRDVILKKLEEGQLDDEGLKLTAAVLTKNPDLYMFWNYRKRTLLSLIESTTNSSNVVTSDSQSVAAGDVVTGDSQSAASGDAAAKKIDMEAYYRSELALTEECLRDNPKSYAAWYHRQWILQKYFRAGTPTAAADLLKAELRHCAEALKYDERNFHCWDHRRFVCRIASVPEMNELQFSKEKIDENFSNYSAWHYRSALLPRLFPPEQRGATLRLEENKLNEELLYVQNAFFTDPEDQSAWFYHCWLFRPMEKETEELVLRYCGFDATKPTAVILSFNCAVSLNGPSSPVSLMVDDSRVLESGWSTPDGSRSCQIWINILTSEKADSLFAGKSAFKVCIRGKAALELGLKTATDNHGSPFEHIALTNWSDALQPALPSAFREAMENSMNSCRELKSLVEPTSNKWPSLTEILSMRSLDLLKFESTIQAGLDILKQVDPLKRAYYDDLKSKYLVEAHLLKASADGSRIPTLNLAGLGITGLPSSGTIMLMIGISDLNLDRNRLTSVVPLGYLLSLRRLSLNENLLAVAKGIGSLLHLEYLSLRSNRLGPTCVDALSSLKGCGSLRELILAGNSVCESEGQERILAFLAIPSLSVTL